MNTSSKVFFNTIALYIKLFITIIVGLYLTRVVLDRLGVEDYGIYNLIGGVIALLSFLQTALSVSTQRFLSVSMGEKNNNTTTIVFSSSLAIHIVLSICVLIIFELCSLFLFNGFLNIPNDRMWAAKLVYQIMVLTTFFTILQVPFAADLTANEDLWLLAIVETISSLLKLCIIFLFDWCSLDALILYSFWMFICTLISFIPKMLWCTYKYKECKVLLFWKFASKNSILEMIGFTGWNAFGTLAQVGRNQGVAILQNIFFGPAINAVYGIANQVNSHLIYCSSIMTTSITPQIMKSEGDGDRKRMLRLSIFASKLAFALSSVFALPLIIEIDTILDFWLKEVPEYTKTYCILILIMFLIMQLYPGLTRAVQATGKIKLYQVITSLLLILPIPIGYLLYKAGMHHTIILYLMILSQLLQMIYTVWYVTKNIGLNYKKFCAYIIKAVLIFLSIYLLGNYLHFLFLPHLSELLTFLISCSAVVLTFIFISFFVVFEKQERDSVINLLRSLACKKR